MKCYVGPTMQALVNTVINLQVPYKAGNFMTSSVTI